MNNKMSIERIADRLDTLAEITPDRSKMALERIADAIENYSGGGGGSSDLFYVKFSWDSQHNAFVADKSLEELTVAITEHNYILGSVNDSILTFDSEPISFTRTYCSVNTGVIQTLLPDLDNEDELTYWILQTNTWQTTQQAG